MSQSIFFDIVGRDRASATFSRIGRSSDTAHSRIRRLAGGVGKLAGIAGVAGFGAGLVSFLKDSNAEAREAQRAGALTNQVIKSTGGVANVTAGHVGDLANAISKKIGVDDEAIQSGENLLLTFKNIRNETGKGNRIFDQATHASVDLAAGLSAASGGQLNLRSSTTLVGKALNDPIKGLTALRRVGVDFTKQQQDQIKKLVESGQKMKAQKIILKELKSEFGGAAKSQATAGDKARVAWKNLEEQIGTALLPTVDRLAKFAGDDLVPAISKFVSGMQDGTGAGGKFADILKDTASVGKTALKILDAIPGPVKKFGVEGLIAYGVLRKMQAGMTGLGGSLALPIARTKQMYAEMTYAETRLQRVGVVSRAMGGALRNAAGTGGMLLLADATGRVGTKMGVLESAAGGALSGAALGAFAGPQGAAVGAAIGGLAGGALALFRNTKSAGDAAAGAIGKWQTYAATLDQVSGATTEATRAAALKAAADAGVLKTTRSLGISDRQVVNALVSGGKARDKVIATVKREVSAIDEQIAAKKRELDANNAASYDYAHLTSAQIRAAQDRADANRSELSALEDLRDKRKKDVQSVLDGVGAVRKSVIETQKSAAAIVDLTGKLHGIPKAKATKIRAEGIIPTTKGIIDLAEKYRLTPKQVRTAIGATGVPFTQKQIDRIVNRVVAYGKLHPNPKIDANTAPAIAKLTPLEQRLQRIASRTYTASVGILTFNSGGGGGKGKGKGKGKGSGGGAAAGGGKSDRMMEDAGRSTGESYARGVNRARTTVKKALAKYADLASKAADKLASLKDTKAGFLSTFTSDNLFGADLSGGGGIGALLQFEQKQAQQASQLMSDVQTALSKGLSKSLVSQLQSQGTSGAAALHALASGSAAQIAQFNELDKQTQSSLQGAGLAAGNYIRGGSIDLSIAAAARQERLLADVVRELKSMKGDQIVVIDGDGVVLAVKKRNHKKGVRTSDQLVRALT